MEKLPGAAGSTTKSLLETGKSMWALVANPIGAAIAAIAAVFYILYSVFKDFKPVVDKVEQSFAALGAVFAVIKNSIIGLLTGTKSLTETFSSLGGAMSGAAKDASELKKAQQELEDGQANIEVQNKSAETQIQKLILQSKNRTLTEKERIALIDQAVKIEEGAFARSKKQSDEEVRIAQTKLIVGKNLTKEEITRLRTEGIAYARLLQDKKGITDEEIEGLKTALLKREDISQQSISIQEKAQNRRDVLEEKAQANKEKAAAAAVTANEKRVAAHEKAVEKELKSDQNILALKIANQKNFNAEMLTSDTYYNGRIDMINSNWIDEKKIIDKELAYKKINAQEAALKYVDAEKKKNDSIKVLSQAKLNQILSNMQYEMQLEKSQNDQILAGKKRTSEEIYFSDLLQIKVDQDNKIKAENEKLKSEKTYLNEYNKQVALINQQAKTSEAQLNATFDEKERQRKLDTQLVDLNNELEIVQGNIDAEYQIKLELLEKKRTAELLAAETTGASVAMINAKFNKLEAQNDTDKFKAKFAAIKQYADSGMSILSGFNELSKQIEAGQLQDAESANSAKTKDLDDRLSKGLISQKVHDAGVAASNSELDKKKAKIAHDQAVREKELNIFKTIINTASAVVAALPNIFLSVAAGVAGAIELATIIATPVPKAAKGGLVVGNSHANGGVLIEAEGGERIINKKSSSQFGGLLDGINGIGNGAAFAPQTARFSNDGGYTARQIQNSGGATPEQLQAAMEKALTKMKVYTTVVDIKKADVNYTKIEDRGSF